MRAATLPYKVRRITFSVQLGLVAHPDFWVVIGYGRKSITSSMPWITVNAPLKQLVYPMLDAENVANSLLSLNEMLRTFRRYCNLE